jgi:hypothetical protein
MVGGCCGIGPEFIAALAGRAAPPPAESVSPLPAEGGAAVFAAAVAAGRGGGGGGGVRGTREPPLLAPTLLCGWLEVAVLHVPRGLRAEVAHVLPGVALDDAPPLLLVPTAQRAALELVAWGDAAAAEKDRLLERFSRWAAAVCGALEARGFWADYVDPCSGLPVRTPRANAVYAEVDAFEALLKWRTSSAGGCRVLLHPQWGAAVYPASLFAKAPPQALREAMEAAAREEAAR